MGGPAQRPEPFGTETSSPPPPLAQAVSPFPFPGEVRVCPSPQGECQARQRPQPTAADSLQLGVGAWRAAPCAWAGVGSVCTLGQGHLLSSGSGTRGGGGCWPRSRFTGSEPSGDKAGDPVSSWGPAPSLGACWRDGLPPTLLPGKSSQPLCASTKGALCPVYPPPCPLPGSGVEPDPCRLQRRWSLLGGLSPGPRGSVPFL